MLLPFGMVKRYFSCSEIEAQWLIINSLMEQYRKGTDLELLKRQIGGNISIILDMCQDIENAIRIHGQ